jgi:tocopherol O-methyltransferase
MNQTSNNEEIASYYKRSGWLYKYMWYSRKSLGLHYGFWDAQTHSHDEALNNQFKQVIEKAKIKKNMKVLDAGCGVGGGAIYVARYTGASVTGITISPNQVAEAMDNAKQAEVDQLTEFLLADYTKMPFADQSFDVVFAVESACYAYPKQSFLKEAYRVLKSGGTLVTSDGYATRKPHSEEEKKILTRFCEGWRLKELIGVVQMTDVIKSCGFSEIVLINKTEEVQPSLLRMRWLIMLAKPLLWLGIIRDNVRSMQASIDGVKRGLMGYYLHVAHK